MSNDKILSESIAYLFQYWSIHRESLKEKQKYIFSYVCPIIYVLQCGYVKNNLLVKVNEQMHGTIFFVFYYCGVLKRAVKLSFFFLSL